MSPPVEVVFFDVGGPIYGDETYANALLGGLERLGARVEPAAFWSEYERCRRAQAGFTRPLAERFGVDPGELAHAAASAWSHPPQALYDDVLPALEQLAAHHRIGILANQPSAARAALERDGVARYVELWAISADVGLAKPDPAIFAHAVALAGCAPAAVAFVGNRLDNDIVPARAAGILAVWLLRGEAPAEPTAEQLAVPDAVIRSLAELPAVLSRRARLPAP